MRELASERVVAPTRPLESDSTPVQGSGRIARNAAHLVFGQIATTLLSIVLSAQLGRGLGATDYGLYFFLLSTAYLVHNVAEWGQTSVVIRDVARKPEWSRALLGASLLFRVGGSIPGAILAAMVAGLLGHDGRTQALIGLTVVAFIPNALTLAYGQVFRGHERMELDARATVLAKVLHLVLVIAVLQLGGGLVGVIVAFAIASLASLAYAAFKARGLGLGRPLLERAAVRHLFREGAPLVTLSVLQHVQPYVELLILATLCPGVVLGWYGAARTVSNTLVMPTSIMLTASMPTLSRAAAEPDQLRRAVTMTMRWVFAIGVLVAVGTVLFAGGAIRLIFGEQGFGPAATILQWMSIFLLLMFVNMLAGSVAIVTARAGALATIRVVVMVVTLAAAWWLVPLAQGRWENGALGSLAAATIGEAMMLAACALILPRGVLSRSLAIDLMRALAAGAFAVLIIRGLGIDSLWIGVPACTSGYAAAAVATGLVGRDEVAAIRSMLRRRAG